MSHVVGDVVAANFLTSALLSWAIPIALLLTVVVWWGIVLTRRAFKSERREL
jgi:hypothetical protein